MSILVKTIPFVPMGRNARDRAHWAERKKEMDDWVLLIPNCAKKNRQAKGDKRRMVEIVFRKSRGPLSDPDNLVARAKVPLDALVRRGWILDDSPEHIELNVREEVTGKRGQTVIAVSEAQPKAEPLPACPDGVPCDRGCRGGCWRATYGEIAA